MKKVLPPHSRKRALSEEEKALWRAVAKSTTPLRRRKPVIIDDDEDEAADVPRPAARQSRPSPAPQTRTPATKTSPPPLAPLGRREKSRLAKGRHPIDARLDLHGMTQARAHRTLIAFLHRAHGDGATFVLIITGKGKASVLGRRTRRACGARSRCGWDCRTCAALSSASRRRISATAARALCTCGCGGRGDIYRCAATTFIYLQN